MWLDEIMAYPFAVKGPLQCGGVFGVSVGFTPVANVLPAVACIVRLHVIRVNIRLRNVSGRLQGREFLLPSNNGRATHLKSSCSRALTRSLIIRTVAIKLMGVLTRYIAESFVSL